MRRRMSGTWLALPLTLGLALAGCGGPDSGTGVATAGGGTGAEPTASASAAALSNEDRQREFAKCMRENGVDMPDPEPGQGGIRVQSGPDDREKMGAAMEKCRSLLPNGGEGMKLDAKQIEQVRQMAKCMRENGVPDFPDPGADGTINFQAGAGLDREDPKFQAAMEKCRGNFPIRARESR
ncbi:hypothetical protein I0C86_17015 [Plantactinospora sp. S1510]|uniref:Lipoprotein n=1 Tax=Plantactinospora alkalitolerans TaxID=2789879 RepID=A0ABS0GWT1_9ACTN|nr:hypothetical protein [Plantactinospora alkalitolerans]MBF9130646.1 hypothetical protein [Plantactinospora alkalitolerans]